MTGQAILRLIGRFRLENGGACAGLSSLKSQALVAYLACQDSGAATREKLAALLWSESEATQGRASLRQTLRSIRLALEEISLENLIDSDARSITLRRDLVQVDTEALVRDILAGGLPAALTEQEGLTERILADLELVDPAFTAWVSAYRASVHNRLVTVLEERLATMSSTSSAGMGIARALLNLEPSREVAHRFLMRAHLAAGDIAAAMKTYEALWQLLDEEYEVEPSRQTQALAVELKLGTGETEHAEPRHGELIAPEDGLREQRLAIQFLPFDLSELSADERIVVEGFRFDLMGSLARFRDWVVIDWDLVPKDADMESPHVFAVRGRAMGAAPDIRLMLHLVDSRSGGLVWSEVIPLGRDEWIDAQNMIIRRVAVALNVHISAEKLANVSRLADTDLSIYERWLRGQALITHWRPEDDNRAEQLFRSILRDDPFFAPAYTGVAQILNARHHMLPGTWRSEEVQEEALSLAEKAVSMDPLDSRSRLCTAWSKAMTGSFDAAQLGFSLACELNQNDPWTLVSSSLGFAYCGDPGRGDELGRQMLDLGLGASPLHWAYHAGVMFMNEDYPACVIAAERGMDSTFYLGAWKASAHAHQGESDEAAREFERFAALIRKRWIGPTPPDDDEIVEWLLHCYPIRDPVDLDRLRDGLRRAAAAGPSPSSGRPGGGGTRPEGLSGSPR